jgi:hypothetical protein
MKSPVTTSTSSSSRTQAVAVVSQPPRAFPMRLARLLIIFLTSHVILLGAVLLLVR